MMQKIKSWWHWGICCFVLLQGAESLGQEDVNLDEVGLEMVIPSESPSRPIPHSPLHLPVPPPDIQNWMTFMSEAEDGYARASFPIFLLTTGEIVNAKGYAILDRDFRPISISLPLPPFETLVWQVVWEKVTDEEKAPPLDLALHCTLILMITNPAPSPWSLPKAISDEDTKDAGNIIGEERHVKIPLYPPHEVMNEQCIRLFVGKDLPSLFRNWIVVEDIPHATVVEHIQRIGESCFKDRRCLLTSFYQDRCTASLVTSLISDKYYPTELLGEIIKEEKEFLGEDASGLEEYLKQNHFFYSALRFAHRYHYGLSLVLLLALSSVSKPQKHADQRVQTVAREFVFRCYQTMRHPISRFFQNMLRRAPQGDLLLFPVLSNHLRGGRGGR